MDWSGCKWVESVPDWMSGTPVLRNTRVDVDGLLHNFDDGLSVEELIEEFGLDEESVRGVLEFAQC
jgi:uncharacterized protein (DUF433 family)